MRIVNFDDKEANSRLCSYQETAVTDELYGFGSMLVSEFVDRIHHLDAKAGSLAGYASGIVALLVSTSAFWRSALHPWAICLVLVAAISALASAGLCLWAASIYKFMWFSDDEWMQEAYLDNAEDLRKYHVLTMHNVVQSHRKGGTEKSKHIRHAQWALAFTATLLFVALADAIFKSPGISTAMHSSLLCRDLGDLAAAALGAARSLV
jgi:hypothetical protein